MATVRPPGPGLSWYNVLCPGRNKPTGDTGVEALETSAVGSARQVRSGRVGSMNVLYDKPLVSEQHGASSVKNCLEASQIRSWRSSRAHHQRAAYQCHEVCL